MKKLLLSILAALMLVRAEPAQALTWADFGNYTTNIVSTFFTSQNAPKLFGGALIAFGLASVLLSLKKDKSNDAKRSSIRPSHA